MGNGAAINYDQKSIQIASEEKWEEITQFIQFHRQMLFLNFQERF